MNNTTFEALLKKGIVLMDGAMGTYYANKQNDYINLCEKANMTHPQVIKAIHHEYINAGAQVIRTNTFSANSQDFKEPFEEVKKIIHTGYQLAKEATEDKEVLVACSIGPISESSELSEHEVLLEYERIIDAFLDLGAELFLFETFSHTEYVNHFINYIKSKNSKAEILVSFAVNYQGYTKKGLGIKRILEDLKQIEGITAFGFNCSVGAGHLLNLLKQVDTTYPILAMPNAGYPEVNLDRTFYRDNATYFAETILDICKLGVKVVGGCCGTTPKHIQYIAENLKHLGPISSHKKEQPLISLTANKNIHNKFHEKLSNNEFVIAVEIDPPFGYDVTKLMEAAHILKAVGVDILTIADSPLGKVRLDSLMMATKINREVGIDVMPHVCCRDKNTIALKALLSAAYVEGIRNYLFVTGDPIPDGSRNEAKAVFHMNSVKLMSLVKEMNSEIKEQDTFIYGGALNPKLPNMGKVIEKVHQKMEAGAQYLLTQPIYTQQEIEHLTLIKERTGIKILGGILPLVSYRNARFIDNEFAGMNIPEAIINRFKPEMSREEAESVGIECAVEVAKAMKGVVDGLYFMTPFNRASMIARILKKI